MNQLADWQKQHPEELFNLLSRVVPYLRHKDWETRTTAAKAIGKIIENAELYDPNPGEEIVHPKKDEDSLDNGFVKKEEAEPTIPDDDNLTLGALDVSTIIKYGRQLLRGGTVDYALAALEPQDRLAHQKKTLIGRLGLLGRLYEDEEIPISNESAVSPGTPADLNGSNGFGRLDPNGSATTPHPTEESGMSARQLNVLKRKRKREAQKAAQSKGGFGDLSLRRAGTAGSEGFADETPMADADSKKNGKVADYFSLDRPADIEEDTKVVSEYKGPVIQDVKTELQTDAETEGSEWPYERLCEFLKVDLFDPSWEIRHGAAMGLREVVRVHGGGAGRVQRRSLVENNERNRKWLDDVACRLCCVLMLDRFTDYSSDTSVAPIRETVGQTLGSVLFHIPANSVHAIYSILYRMVMQEDLPLEQHVWPICHGGMVGLRYVVAVRKDLLLQDGDMIDGIIRSVMKGLGDRDDDVRSVSAATLIPMAKEFVTQRPGELNGLINIVWEGLADLSDDLSASTGKIMDLLAILCSYPEVLAVMKASAKEDDERSFTVLVPRLYPFLRHTITSVRLAVLKALMTFAKLDAESAQGWLNGRILRLIFQNLLVERDQVTLSMSMELWTALVNSLARTPDLLATEFYTHVDPLMQLTLHPIGVQRHPLPVDATLFLKPSGGTYAPMSGAPAPSRKSSPSEGVERATKRRRKSTKVEEPAASSQSHDLDGRMMQGDVDLVGMETLVRSRIYAAKAMGLIMSLLPAADLQEYDASITQGLSSPFSSTQLSACMVLDEYAKSSKNVEQCSRFVAPLQKMVEGDRPSCYRDLVSYVRAVRTQCSQLIGLFRDHGKVSSNKLPVLAVIVQGEAEAGPGAFSIANAEKVASEDYDRLKKVMAPGQRLIASQQLAEVRDNTLLAIEEAKAKKESRDVRIKAAAACALVAIKYLPKKPSPLIKAIMDSIKYEENQELQGRSASTIAMLVQHFTESGRRGPADKVVGNLVKFSCMEVAETPEFPVHASKTNVVLSMQKEEDRVDHPDAAKWAREAKAARITRRGAKEALQILSQNFGSELLTVVPSIRTFMEQPMLQAFSSDLPAEAKDPENTFGQEIVDAMSVIRTMTPTIDPALHPFIMQMVPLIIKALHSELSVFRYMAAKCMATICSVITVEGITALVEQVLPSINNPIDLNFRQGATETIYHLIAVMGDSILPYVVFLIVSTLR